MKLVSMSENLDQVVQCLEKQRNSYGQLPGLSTGLTDLDKVTDGLEPGDFWLIAARPAMGCTSLCLHIADSVAVEQNKPVAIFNYETPANWLIVRMICAENSLSARTICVSGPADSEFLSVSNNQWIKFKDSIPRYKNAPLFFNAPCNLDFSELVSHCKKLRSNISGMALIIIDDIQRLCQTDPSFPYPPDTTEISAQLKALAVETASAIIAVSPVSRQIDNRKDKRPILRDLRDWGKIDAYADVVCCLYRDVYYHPETKYRGIVELLVIKNQKLSYTGTIELGYESSCSRFGDAINLVHT